MNIWSCRFITVDDNSSKIKCWQVGDAFCLAWKALEPPTTNSTLVPFLGRKVHLSLNVCMVVAVVDCALLSVRRISGDCKDVYVQAEQSTRKPRVSLLASRSDLPGAARHEVQAVPLCACNWSPHWHSCRTSCFGLSGTQNARIRPALTTN